MSACCSQWSPLSLSHSEDHCEVLLLEDLFFEDLLLEDLHEELSVKMKSIFDYLLV
jgi:hypothetical protein